MTNEREERRRRNKLIDKKNIKIKTSKYIAKHGIEYIFIALKRLMWALFCIRREVTLKSYGDRQPENSDC